MRTRSLSRQCATNVKVTITEMVLIHNLLGSLYMLPVAPVHKFILTSVMRVLG